LKKLLKICAAVFALVTVFSLAGCSARTPITADEFTKQAKAAGFTVKEESAASNLDVDKLISATKSEAGTEIIFVSVKTDSAAEDMYKSIKTSISKDTSGTTSNLDSATYNKYTLVNGELNHTLVRMNKTIVYGKANTSVKDQVDSFFKTINY
jgi:uncharacterized lipoprotein YehR (DUF1307 family)